MRKISILSQREYLRNAGTPITEAIRQGAERRFVPIVLTTLTTILGLLPLTAQATGLWSLDYSPKYFGAARSPLFTSRSINPSAERGGRVEPAICR